MSFIFLIGIGIEDEEKGPNNKVSLRKPRKDIKRILLLLHKCGNYVQKTYTYHRIISLLSNAFDKRWFRHFFHFRKRLTMMLLWTFFSRLPFKLFIISSLTRKNRVEIGYQNIKKVLHWNENEYVDNEICFWKGAHIFLKKQSSAKGINTHCKSS